MVLNGTSSVLYGTVSEFVSENRHARAFGLFYTVLLASGAVAPILFGAVGDAMGLETSFAIIALLAGCIILICPFLSPPNCETVARLRIFFPLLLRPALEKEYSNGPHYGNTKTFCFSITDFTGFRVDEMIKLSRLTDYSVVVMSQMAQDMSVTRTAPELAAATGVPAPTVAKLLKLLLKGGLVESWRGVNGGYALVRNLDEITAADIIEALEGPVALTACVDGSDADCGVEALCPMRGGWEKVNRAIRARVGRGDTRRIEPACRFFDGATGTGSRNERRKGLKTWSRMSKR